MSTLTIMSNDSTFPLFIHFPLFAWVCVCVHKQFVQWTFWALRCFDKRCQLQNVLEDCAECTDFCGCHQLPPASGSKLNFQIILFSAKADQVVHYERVQTPCVPQNDLPTSKNVSKMQKIAWKFGLTK